MSGTVRTALLALGLCTLVAAGCAKQSEAENTQADAGSTATTLKGAFDGKFLVGAAINQRQFAGSDSSGAELIRAQFNAIAPENVLKWERVHPRKGEYNFPPADEYVKFGEDNGMFVHGHTLVWHSQTPRWVFEDGQGNPVSRDTLLARMHDHIATVVGRYKGRIKGWDVVNEALNEDGTLRDSPWHRIIGDDYLVKAFQFAHEADPAAELYYNDYSLENPAKRDGAVKLIRSLQAAGVTVKAIGTQDHLKMDWPSPALMDSMFTAFAAAGVQVNVSELDVDVLPRATRNTGADVSTNVGARSELNPYPTALPDSMQQALAQRYAEIFQIYVKHAPHIDRVTFWGVDDGDSWLNNWPVRGRSNYPLLFDRNGAPKPAFDAVVKTAQ
jgi:endo-1,4-beta-xylanase